MAIGHSLECPNGIFGEWYKAGVPQLTRHSKLSISFYHASRIKPIVIYVTGRAEDSIAAKRSPAANIRGNTMDEPLTLDCKGLACPQPVLETKRVIEGSEASQIRIIVDNYTSRENVTRFAVNQGFQVDVNEQPGEIYEIMVTRSPRVTPTPGPVVRESAPVPEQAPAQLEPKSVVYIGSATIGKGDDELGAKLMRGFLRTWIDMEPKPWRMIFINGGVKLTSIDEEAAEAVSMLQEQGVEALSCGTCLEHFGLTDKLKVGKITNMYEVLETLNQASKVISPD
jgi:selenium metabolism protein YedF